MLAPRPPEDSRRTVSRSWGCSTSVSASPLASRFGDEVASVDVDDAGNKRGVVQGVNDLIPKPLTGPMPSLRSLR
jgi:hypothetical protein